MPDTEHAQQEPAHGLTLREVQIIRHVAQGLSNKEIAQSMSISWRTVQQHIARATRKTDTRNRTHLAVYSVCARIVPCECAAATGGHEGLSR